MNKLNYIIGLCFAAALIAAIIGMLYAPLMEWLGLALITYPFQFPSQPQLMRCTVCEIDTVHHCTASGEMVCWCGNVANQRAKAETSLKGSE